MAFKKDVIYQKNKEWISINYKSAKDVIQLDTESKIITKGNFVFEYLAGETVVKYRLSNTMTFSVKDNKFKLDLTPIAISAKGFPSLVISRGVYELLMIANILSENDSLILAKKITLKQFILNGFKQEKALKMLKKVDKYIIEGDNSYRLNHRYFKEGVKNTFISIKNTVIEVDDW